MRALVLIAVLPLLGACASTVQRVDPLTQTDYSGDWNDTDSRLVAEQMILDCLAKPWIEDYKAAHTGAKPVVIVGSVRNRSSEHIAIATFTKDLERELINAGKVRFVASKAEREDVREEREDQQANAGAASMKKLRSETGADYMLIGSIDSIVDSKGGASAVTYQVNLELIGMESNEKAWIGTKDIKKIVKRPRVGR